MLKKNDAKGIAEIVRYPFERQYPIPSIKNKEEFVARYNEIFDENLKEKIIHSDINKDWRQMGWRGIMLDNGILWLGDGLIVDYQTDFEKRERERLIKQQKTVIYPDLKNFFEPTLLWKTKTRVIRVDLTQFDSMGDSTYRFAFWSLYSYKKQEDKPDLILKNGKMGSDGGNGGNYWISFKDGFYIYKVAISNIGPEDIYPLEFSISRGDIQIINQEAEEIDFSAVS